MIRALRRQALASRDLNFDIKPYKLIIKNNFLTFYYITFVNVFFDDVFDEIYIYNHIEKFIEILLIQIIYTNIL